MGIDDLVTECVEIGTKLLDFTKNSKRLMFICDKRTEVSTPDQQDRQRFRRFPARFLNRSIVSVYSVVHHTILYPDWV